MAYLWTTTAEIQAFLDEESIISIGDGASDTYAEADAMTLENATVVEIVAYLSPFFIISTSTVNALLSALTAKMTAAQIGLARMGASMGNEPANWTYRLKNEAWAALYRIAVSQSLPGVSAKTISVGDRLVYAKIRERSLIPNV